MIELMQGIVKQIIYSDEKIDEIILDIDHDEKKAINYNQMTGKAEIGDTVLLNTSACSLGLGTGGYHFVVANNRIKWKVSTGKGHGMKLKYTPLQVRVLLSEEEDSPYHQKFFNGLDLYGKLTFVGELHSMLPPLCSYIKYHSFNKAKVAYIMTDHGALPIAFSKNVQQLKERGLLDTTITTGNAFGGDFECINIYTALQSAFNIARCHIAIITMGPGILGTNTPYGFSGLELGLYLNLIKDLGGKVLYIPRMSFADQRKRHFGLSHHTLLVLKEISQKRQKIILPLLDKKRCRFVFKQLKEHNILGRHSVLFCDGSGIKDALKYHGLNPTTMGRDIMEDPYFFYALGAIGKYGLSNIYPHI